MAKKGKKYRCPHCKQEVKIEDLEVIEDTRGGIGQPQMI